MSSEQQIEQTSNTTIADTNVNTSTTPTQLQTITVPEGQRHIARVKWFDNTLSYGFATVSAGEHAGRDIFVHQSNILTLAQGIYRTLRMGEYIEFNVEESAENNHRYQAIAVTGPGAGLLMCESNPRRPRVFQPRNGSDAVAATNNTNTAAGETNQPAQQTRQPRQNGYQGRQNQGRGYQGRGYHNQAPIQVVVEYPNPVRQQRRSRPPRQNNKQQTSTASAAANIAATLNAGN
jgi:cold shock CspA family protein